MADVSYAYVHEQMCLCAVQDLRSFAYCCCYCCSCCCLLGRVLACLPYCFVTQLNCVVHKRTFTCMYVRVRTLLRAVGTTDSAALYLEQYESRIA